MAIAMATHDFARALRRQRRRAADLLATINAWRQRARSRRELFMMNDIELRDVGLNRMDVIREARKPFWRR